MKQSLNREDMKKTIKFWLWGVTYYVIMGAAAWVIYQAIWGG